MDTNVKRLVGKPLGRLTFQVTHSKNFGIATRYDKTATSYAAGIAIAATLDWFKSVR
jgi:hypothetical protein